MTNNQKIIFVVDDNNANLIACKEILKSEYVVYPVISAEKMFDLLKHVKPDMILLDVEMPQMDGYEAAKKLKADEAYSKIPIIFLTGRNDAASEMEGLDLGALDYIHKPFVGKLFLRRIGLYLSLINSREEMRAPLNDIIGMLNAALETGDPEKIKDCLEKANSAAARLLALTDDPS